MQFIVNGIKADVTTSDGETLQRFKKQYTRGHDSEVFIYKKSIDARKKNNIKFIYSFLIKTEDKGLIAKLSKLKNVSSYSPVPLNVTSGEKILF